MCGTDAAQMTGAVTLLMDAGGTAVVVVAAVDGAVDDVPCEIGAAT